VQSLIVTAEMEVSQVQSIIILGAHTGTFKVTNGIIKTRNIKHDATAAQMQSALRALPSIFRGVKVTTTRLNSFGGRSWNITFAPSLADVTLLGIDDADLSGLGDRVRVVGLVNGGRIPLSGDFGLSLDMNQDGTSPRQQHTVSFDRYSDAFLHYMRQEYEISLDPFRTTCLQ
jgi:hypothetical protein